MTVRLRDYLEDYGDLVSAHDAYLADLISKAAESGVSDSTHHLAHRAAVSLQSLVRRVSGAFEQGHAPAAMIATWRSDARVFVGDAGKRFWTQRVDGNNAIMIDLDLYCRLVLFVYFVGLDRDEDVVADGLSALLLLSIVVPRDEDFPRLQELMKAVAQRDSRLINDIFMRVGEFIVFHEIGHSYTAECGHDFVQVAFEISPGTSVDHIRNVRRHQDGPIYNLLEAPNRRTGVLLMAPSCEPWTDEFGSDVFALYANLLAFTHERPNARDLERVAEGLTVWQLLLWAVGSRESYTHVISGTSDFMSHSHPTAHIRMDIVVHHLDHMAEEYAPEWLSPALGKLRSSYESIWASDLASKLSQGVEYVRYAFDEDGPEINVGRTWTFTGKPVQCHPSTLSRLREQFLDPLLEKIELKGWDKAVDDHLDEHLAYLRTFGVNEVPTLLQLGMRLRKIGVRLISEDRT
ncbi:hypothetical protein BKK79_37260 (plasmid) [Cupriavidus sp. USMAA2-4]|uniref:hypothetical protein n=1 Tax=Cupriavidus sp. USMAA2-4 TaxID=876364 RepID=UPI0008A6CFC5|nr:hypothetical protein [Cupriavidus sp. USMAA2-4]AOY97587.1 hypothetical protein BKK79_37260 [Cupriavidus sp. USMAA2-4]